VSAVALGDQIGIRIDGLAPLVITITPPET